MTLGWSETQDPATLFREGPRIGVEICHPQSVLAVFQERHMVAPLPQTIVALIDTGATYSAIDFRLAHQLGLVEIGKTSVVSAAGINIHPVYLAALRFLSLPLQGYDPIQLLGVSLVIHSNPPTEGVQCLIGRDILSHLLMIYNGQQGQITLAQ